MAAKSPVPPVNGELIQTPYVRRDVTVRISLCPMYMYIAGHLLQVVRQPGFRGWKYSSHYFLRALYAHKNPHLLAGVEVVMYMYKQY